MKIRNSIFITLLLTPSVFVFVLNSVEKTNNIDILASINDLVGITLLPFIGSFLLKNNPSFLLAALIPLILIFTKSLFFDGAERIVTIGLVLFVSISLISCSFGCAIKYTYHKHLTKRSS